MNQGDEEPRYVISVVARMLRIQTHTLRYYEKMGIMEPSRSRGNIRLYSDRDVAHLRRVKALTDDLGVNLAGAEVILRMAQRIADLQHQVEGLETELKRLRRKES